MPRWPVLLLLPLLATADERFIEIDAGPFQLLSSAGDRNARDALNQLEQLRASLGMVLGKPELKTYWPVRLLMRKTQAALPPVLARDAFLAALPAEPAVPPPVLRESARILLESNCPRMPAWIEQGLESFYSTLQAGGPRITLGQPPPAAERNFNWARIHLLQVSPDYYGKLRVLLYNLQQGVDLTAAFRNAFGKTPAEIDAQARQYLAAGNFSTVQTSGKPIDPRRDFRVNPVAPAAAETALADLEFIRGGGRASYQALRNTAPAAGHEGLGLVELRDKHPTEARQEFSDAVAAGSTSARAWVEQARLEPDAAKARAALEKAAQLNPNWDEPHALLAQRDPARRLAELEIAAKLAPRDAARWQALAEADLAANKYPEAAKAWTAAENASLDDAERARIQAARRAIEQQRLDYEAAERKRRQEEQERELRELKEKAMARVHEAENRANQGEKTPPGRIIIPWQGEGEAPSSKLRGRLVQVDCLRGPVRVVIADPQGKRTRLLLRNPRQVIVIGGGELSLTCGLQHKPRAVAIEYFPKHDAKLGTAGEVATIEYTDKQD